LPEYRAPFLFGSRPITYSIITGVLVKKYL
jgi:hypothetical protein